MNNIKNFQGYTTNLKKSGLAKNDMIDYIAGIYNNNATRNDCLAFTMRYLSPKNPATISNESEFRRMLKGSEDKVVREIYAVAKERYSHVSRYRDDKVDQFDKTLTQIENEKLTKKDMKKESFDELETTMDFGMDNTTSNTVNIQQVNNDLASKMGDIETHLRDLVSSDSIQLNQDQMDAISRMEKLEELGELDLTNILEKLQTIDDNKTKLLVMKANMYLGKVLKESK